MAELSINNLLPEEQRNKIKYATGFKADRQHFQQINEEINFFIEMALHT